MSTTLLLFGPYQRCGAFVGGTIPLSILQGRRWQGGTFDLYVPKSKVEILKAHLAIEEHYQTDRKWSIGLQVVTIYPPVCCLEQV